MVHGEGQFDDFFPLEEKTKDAECINQHRSKAGTLEFTCFGINTAVHNVMDKPSFGIMTRQPGCCQKKRLFFCRLEGKFSVALRFPRD